MKLSGSVKKQREGAIWRQGGKTGGRRSWTGPTQAGYASESNFCYVRVPAQIPGTNSVELRARWLRVGESRKTILEIGMRRCCVGVSRLARRFDGGRRARRGDPCETMRAQAHDKTLDCRTTPSLAARREAQGMMRPRSFYFLSLLDSAMEWVCLVSVCSLLRTVLSLENFTSFPTLEERSDVSLGGVPQINLTHSRFLV